MIRYIILVLLNISFIQLTLIAQEDFQQDEKKLFLITKTDGGEFIGEIISDDGREILLMTTTIGKIYINKSDISNISAVDEKSNNKIGGEFRAEGPFTTRYFFTNNSLPIKKKEHYAMIQLYGPEIHFSVSDNFSLGIMTSWIGSPIAIASKLYLGSNNNTHFSIGTILGNSGYIQQGRLSGGLHWFTITKGDRLKNFTVSGGYGYFLNNSDSQDALIISIAAITPIGKKASLIFDSMIISNKKDNPNYGRINSSNSWIFNGSNYNNTDSEITNTTFIMMPSLRINQSYEKAFQISLAGVIRIDNSKMKGHNSSSFPVPTLSWLRKF
ncbi:MAG: hypothetical protein CL837_06595 [Crocinitomicaceae bacterium]|nr:hypothetical protein [Crocinitomicaceae bacterium]